MGDLLYLTSACTSSAAMHCKCDFDYMLSQIKRNTTLFSSVFNICSDSNWGHTEFLRSCEREVEITESSWLSGECCLPIGGSKCELWCEEHYWRKILRKFTLSESHVTQMRLYSLWVYICLYLEARVFELFSKNIICHCTAACTYL